MADLYAKVRLDLTTTRVFPTQLNADGYYLAQYTVNDQAFSVQIVGGTQYLVGISELQSPFQGVSTLTETTKYEESPTPSTNVFGPGNFYVSAEASATSAQDPWSIADGESSVSGTYSSVIPSVNVPNAVYSKFVPGDNVADFIFITVAGIGNTVVVPSGADPAAAITDYSAPLVEHSFTFNYNADLVGTNFPTITDVFEISLPEYVWVDLGPASLFSSGADAINFNELSQTQRLEIAAGADSSQGLGGNDVVTLPKKNYELIFGSATPAMTFVTGSKKGDAYTVNGTDGNYNVVLGLGSDAVNFTGGINSTSTIFGDGGNYTVKLGEGTDTVSIQGSGKSTIQTTAGSYALNLGKDVNDSGQYALSLGSGTDVVHLFGSGISSISGTDGVYNFLISGKRDVSIDINGRATTTISAAFGTLDLHLTDGPSWIGIGSDEVAKVTGTGGNGHAVVVAGGTIGSGQNASLDVGGSAAPQAGLLHIDSNGSVFGYGQITNTQGFNFDPTSGLPPTPVFGDIKNDGLIEASGGTLAINGNLSGNGSAKIDALSTLELNGSDTEQIAFGGDDATLAIDGMILPTGAIKGFGVTDTIDLANIPFDSLNGTAVIDPDNTLMITENGERYTLTLDMSEDYSGDSFRLKSDGEVGTLVELALFTSGRDVVDFNDLDSIQRKLIDEGADLYDGLGGGDTITLPDAKPGDKVVTLAGTNEIFELTHTFSVGDNRAGLTTTLTGGNGDYSIALGLGSDKVTISGDGSSTITGTSGTYTIDLGGAGNDNITINGDGNNVISANDGFSTISITGNGLNKINAGTGSAQVVINGNGQNTIDASLTSDFNVLLSAIGKGNETIIGGDFGNNIRSGVGNDFLKGGNGSDNFTGVGISSQDVQRGNDEINGASYLNLSSTDVVGFLYDHTQYTPKWLPRGTLTLSDGSVSIGYGVIVTPVSKAGTDTIANWNVLQFRDRAFFETGDLDKASTVAYALWSLDNAFNQVKGFIGVTQKLSDPKLKAIGAWFDFAGGMIGALAQVANESDKDFKSAVKVLLIQSVTAVTEPFISQAQSFLDDKIDSLPMPDSWKADAKSAVADGAVDVRAAIGLATSALVDRVSSFNDWSSQWQQWMGDVKQAIVKSYVDLLDTGDPQQEWDDPHLPTPEVPQAPVLRGGGPSIDHLHYLSGAIVFADANGNGQLAANDASTITDANGHFTLIGGIGSLIAFGGTDVATGLPFKGQFSAPAGSNVISPLTTVLNDLQADPFAQQKILSGLALTPTLDLTTFDPIAAAQIGSVDGAATEAAGAKVYDTVALIASTLAAAGGSYTAGSRAAFAAIASAIGGAGINLTNQADISALIKTVAQSENLTLGQGVADSVAAIIVASNVALDGKLQADGSGTTLLNDVAAVEKVIQGTAANAIEQAANDSSQVQSLVGAFTGSNLDAAVANALNHLGSTGDTTPPTLATVADQTIEATSAAGAVAQFSATATDAVDGTIPVVFKEGNTVVHSGDTFALGTHTVTASAVDATGNQATEAFTIYVVDTTAPVLMPVVDQTDEATGPNGAVATFSATATDLVDGTDAVVFKEGNTVVHSGDTFALGTHTITASAIDAVGNLASETFKITVADTTAPELTSIPDQTVHATSPGGASAVFTATATDLVDGSDAVIFKEGNSIVHSGDVFALGNHTISATTTDVGGNTASENFAIDVVDAAPILAHQTAAQAATVGTSFSFTLPSDTFQDPDAGDHLSLTAAVPAWLTFDSTTGTLKGTPGTTDAGSFDVSITATDPAGLSAVDSFHFVVSPAVTTNHPPVITSDGGGATASVIITDDTKYVETVHASDPDPNSKVSYSIVGGDDKKLFTIDSKTGVLSFKSMPRDGHTYDVKVAASDGTLQDTQTITVKVADGLFEFGDKGVADTFVFKPHFGLEVVNSFDSSHDVLELDHSLFKGATSGETGNAALKLIADHSLQLGHDLLIFTDTHDVIDLRSTNIHNLMSHDFVIT